jgi:hypothetical protein
MIYSDTLQAYAANVEGFTSLTTETGMLNITTTLNLATTDVEYIRPYVTPMDIRSFSIGELSLLWFEALPTEAYLALVPSYAPPGPAPAGHRLIGSTYSIRASGVISATDKPMVLSLGYNAQTLTGADPHTLALFVWNASTGHWDSLGGTPDFDRLVLSASTRPLSSYVLMTTPTWRDDFTDLSGVEQTDAISRAGLLENRLVLTSTPGTGSAISVPIIPPDPIVRWGSLTFSRTVDPPTTTLRVDILSLDDTEILTDVASGVDLATIDPIQYPGLKLRVRMASTASGQTPILAQWQLNWVVEEPQVYLYLPLLRKD